MRVGQIWQWVYHWGARDFSQMTNLSKAYRADLAAIAGQGEVKAEDRTVILTAALVGDWSFEEECTPENVQKLLREAPQLRDMIDRYASNDARFFTKPSSDSTTGRKGK